MGRSLLSIAVLVSTLGIGPAPASAGPDAEPTGHVRVDQVGYATGETKRAYLMTASPADGARFAVVDRHGRTVHIGRIGASAGAWSASYGAVHPIDLTAVRAPGTYRVRVTGGVRAEPPVFHVDSPSRLFAPLLAVTVNSSRCSGTAPT